MCFSATASFTTAILTGGVGIAALSKIDRPGEAPMAAIPLVFAAQQTAEGLLWLGFAGHWSAPMMTLAANIFILIALAFWPIWSPLAVGLMEKRPKRRFWIFALLPVGLSLGCYSALSVFVHPYTASVVNRSICYISPSPYPTIAIPFYVLCVVGSLFFSSHPVVRRLGSLVAIGLSVSVVFFYEGFVSVWCFFAAAASVGIYALFHRKPVTSSATAQTTTPYITR